MGLNAAAIRLNMELWERGLFKNIKSVVETGAQELHMDKKEFEQLVASYNLPNYKSKNFTPWGWPGAPPRCSSKPLYELLGAEKYTSIDLTGQYGAIKLDLNLPQNVHSVSSIIGMTWSRKTSR